jgi:hemoglobin-like flavoprotein
MKSQDTPHPATDSDDKRKAEIERDIARTGVALSTSETVSRFGGANAEYIKGYTGMDNEAGKKLHDGLKSLSQQGKGIPQKAGTAAEILATNRDNAENIIDKIPQRSARTDDLSQQYGTNHPVVDRIRIHEDGTVSYAQMKFENNYENLVDKIVSKDGEYAKYLDPQEICAKRAQKHLHNALKAEEKARVAQAEGRLEAAAEHRQNADALRVRAATNEQIGTNEIQLEVPTEQVDLIKKKCLKNASRHRADAASREADAVMQERLGNLEKAHNLREEARDLVEEANRNEKLAKRVVDSGVSQDDANIAASKPLKVTITSTLKTSHRAGMEGAKYGAIIGGCILSLQNAFAVAQGKKDIGNAVKDAVLGTAEAGAIGYGTAFAGAGIKGVMQQSSSQAWRTLANTNAPALAVNVCLSLGSSIKRYVSGDISEAQLLMEAGEKGAGMLSGSMMAALGQLAIPIPFVGAAVGGMIGYTLSSLFYQSALDAARGVETSRELLERTRAIENAARTRIAEEQAALDVFFSREIPALRQETLRLFSAVDASEGQANALAEAINEYAALLGKRLLFQSMTEFNDFMQSDQTLQL